MKNLSLILSVFAMMFVVGCKSGDTTAKDTPDPTTVEGDIPAPEDVAEAPSDANKTDSGLAYKLIKKGSGAVHPQVQDRVEVHYTGWTTDGKMFDSSVKRGNPATFPLRGVITGWTEGLQLMVEGEKTRFWIPKELAYNDQPGKPAGTLVFDVELIKVIPGPKPLPAPDDVAAAPADAVKTDSGLFYKFLTKGSGKHKATMDDQVQLHFTGWTADGQMINSTTTANRPATMAVKQISVKGWQEGVQLMVEGDKARFWISKELGLGERPPMPGAKPGPVVFDIELLKVIEPPKPIPAPSDVKAVPGSAKRTASGLAYKVLTKGKGNAHPAATDVVEVHYTGWTTDGKMFDSSVVRGQPATFPLNRVIKGWTEGVQLMVEGEKTRFWIPGNLAYGDTPSRPGAPAGTLVFDVELLKINAAGGADAHGHPH